MLDLPPWLHDWAALTVVALAAVFLVVRWLRIGRASAAPACARCEHAPSPVRRGSGIRSKQLRVLDQPDNAQMS